MCPKVRCGTSTRPCALIFPPGRFKNVPLPGKSRCHRTTSDDGRATEPAHPHQSAAAWRPWPRYYRPPSGRRTPASVVHPPPGMRVPRMICIVPRPRPRLASEPARRRGAAPPLPPPPLPLVEAPVHHQAGVCRLAGSPVSATLAPPEVHFCYQMFHWGGDRGPAGPLSQSAEGWEGGGGMVAARAPAQGAHHFSPARGRLQAWRQLFAYPSPQCDLRGTPCVGVGRPRGPEHGWLLEPRRARMEELVRPRVAPLLVETRPWCPLRASMVTTPTLAIPSEPFLSPWYHFVWPAVVCPPPPIYP